MASRWKLDNRTHFSGRDLRKLFNEGFKERGINGKQRSRYLVHVAYTRQDRGPSGKAYLNTPELTVRIPIGMCDIEMVAQVFVHEVDHTLGLMHREMGNCWKLDVPWCEGFGIRIVYTKEQVKARVRKLKGK